MCSGLFWCYIVTVMTMTIWKLTAQRSVHAPGTVLVFGVSVFPPGHY